MLEEALGTMQAVILAGGNATRLHCATSHIPKPLMPFFDRPVIEHAVRLLAKHDIRDIIITTSYTATDIMRYFGDGSRWGVKHPLLSREQARGHRRGGQARAAR